MKDEPIGARAGIERIVEIEAILDCYPDVSPEQIHTVKHWFDHEASAYDVGLLASNPLIAERYRRFRIDHIDRLTLPDATKAVALVMVPILAIVAIFLLS